MLKTLKLGKRASFELCKSNVQKRCLLSEAYQCREAWKERLNTNLLRDINVGRMLSDLQMRFQNENIISAIDVDVIANVVRDKQYLDEVLVLIQKLRTLPETISTLESTHHAIIRYLLEIKEYDTLIDILHNRLKYGIFPNHYSYNLLIDTFLEMQDYGRAARIAVLPMLQEDGQNQMTNVLCVYACVKYLEVPETWQKPEEKVVDPNEEEVKVRVDFLRNPYFDNHFDLKEPQDLVGKTFIFYANYMDGILKRSLLLRGMLLFKQYKELLQLVISWKISEQEEDVKLLFEEDIHFFNKTVSTIPAEKKSLEIERVSQQLSILKKKQLSKDQLQKVLLDNLQTKIAEQSDTDMYEQRQKYMDWINVRHQRLEAQRAELEKQEVVRNIEETKSQFVEKERLLTFFDKEEEIELEIEKKEAEVKKNVAKVHKIIRSARKLRKLVASDMYVAPELLEGIDLTFKPKK